MSEYAFFVYLSFKEIKYMKCFSSKSENVNFDVNGILYI